MRATAYAPDGTYVVYRFTGHGNIHGQFYHGTGSPMSDGGFVIGFSWNHGEPTPNNFASIVKEDARKRGLSVRSFERELESVRGPRRPASGQSCAGRRGGFTQIPVMVTGNGVLKRTLEHLPRATEQRVMSEDDYLMDKCGPRPHATFTRATKGMSGAQLRRARTQLSRELDRWGRCQDQHRDEYRRKVKQGRIRPPTRIEQLLRKARGHPDNSSTHAARRVLSKRGLWDDSMSRENDQQFEAVTSKRSSVKGTRNLILAFDPDKEEVSGVTAVGLREAIKARVRQRIVEKFNPGQASRFEAVLRRSIVNKHPGTSIETMQSRGFMGLGQKPVVVLHTPGDAKRFWDHQVDRSDRNRVENLVRGYSSKMDFHRDRIIFK